ncbi:MAG: hypothetical protein KIT84_44860 [Labilithrix sp.]|nr:hypothetical protein [Labilithrix sp.]MCW5818213.1 hypothetical protein [Labilithrix sp.]
MNVEVVGPDATRTVLPHRQGCEDGIGWRWDAAAGPKKVLLCPSTCDTVKVQNGGRVEIELACVDRPDAIH